MPLFVFCFPIDRADKEDTETELGLCLVFSLNGWKVLEPF